MSTNVLCEEKLFNVKDNYTFTFSEENVVFIGAEHIQTNAQNHKCYGHNAKPRCHWYMGDRLKEIFCRKKFLKVINSKKFVKNVPKCNS